MNVYKVRDNATIPEYATDGSACFDVKVCLTVGERLKAYDAWNKEIPILTRQKGDKVTVQIPPETRVLIPTGLIFDIPKKYVMEMFIRSSVATKRGLTLVNSIGIIDSDYVDETHIIVHNISDSLVNVHDGERLAQCRLAEVSVTTIKETKTKPTQKTDRKGGVGSTGV
tara:strand:- start:554 stop:1060 length:507 start_codon:yes stop_codon:yes gene_type:complete